LFEGEMISRGEKEKLLVFTAMKAGAANLCIPHYSAFTVIFSHNM
jgi:hypothetical protein